MSRPGSSDGVRERVQARLEAAERVLVLSGAGISAESGIPTFRGEDGWWRNEDPTRLATPQAFRRDPAYVWEWYEYRRGLIADADPNPGHEAVAGWEAAGKTVLVATQNVDNLHERAGSRNVTHIHGSIWRVRCVECGRERTETPHPLPAVPPHCPQCDGLLRPAVVWFGEMLPAEPMDRIRRILQGGVDIAFVVGTEASFGYIQGFARTARQVGALLVEVNPSRTVLSDVADVRLAGAAGELLPGLLHD